MIKGIICDLDGFLVKTWGTEPLPGVLDTLAVLRERGIKVAVATNQAGPLWRWATGQEKYPTVQEVASRLLVAASRLGLTDVSWYVALYDDRVREVLSATEMPGMGETLCTGLTLALGALPNMVHHGSDWRKPAPGMLYAACSEWNIQPEEAIYGGDLVTDQQAAEAAGMRFIWKLSDVLPMLDE